MSIRPYAGAKVYGPYNYSAPKDAGRKLVNIVWPDGKKKSIQYGKYLLELKLGRYLEPGEETHHKDHDRGNDDPGNLEARPRGDHRKEHAKYFDKPALCEYCGVEFVFTAKRQSSRARDRVTSGPFCSKRCNGKVNH